MSSTSSQHGMSGRTRRPSSCSPTRPRLTPPGQSSTARPSTVGSRGGPSSVSPVLRSLALALIALAAGNCTAMPAPAPSLAPIVLGQRAIRPVPAFGSVWVASAAEGTVQRIDPATGAITATITVAEPQRLLAAGCAPSSEHAFATGSFGLRACDAPSAIAAGGGSIWAVANDANAIVRVDPARNAVTDTIAVGFSAWSLAATDDAVWLSDYANDALVRV